MSADPFLPFQCKKMVKYKLVFDESTLSTLQRLLFNFVTKGKGESETKKLFDR